MTLSSKVLSFGDVELFQVGAKTQVRSVTAASEGQDDERGVAGDEDSQAVRVGGELREARVRHQVQGDQHTHEVGGSILPRLYLLRSYFLFSKARSGLAIF